MREKVGDSYIFLIVDETTNINGNYIANLLTGVLSSENSCNLLLIASKKLEKTNHSTTARFVNDGLRILTILSVRVQALILNRVCLKF